MMMFSVTFMKKYKTVGQSSKTVFLLDAETGVAFFDFPRLTAKSAGVRMSQVKRHL